MAKSAGSIGRMFMPASGAMNATNSFLNMNETLNPTGERELKLKLLKRWLELMARLQKKLMRGD